MSLVTNVVEGSGAQRLFLLLHGYGADERDLGGLLPYLDPEGTFATVMPRAPMSAPGTPGHAWYEFMGGTDVVAGYQEALGPLDALLDEACAARGWERSEAIVGGFSQGAGLALGLAMGVTGNTRPKACLALSPAVPVLGLPEPDAAGDVPVLIQHGTEDPLVPVGQTREVASKLAESGVPVVYEEYPMGHQVALESMQSARDWLARVVAGERPSAPIAEPPPEVVPSVRTAQWETEVLQADLPVIVDFWAPWCGPCRQVSPIVEQIATMREGSYKVVKVNIDEEPAIAQRYDVQSIPMIGLFKDGQLVHRSLGAKPRNQIEAELGMLVLP